LFRAAPRRAAHRNDPCISAIFRYGFVMFCRRSNSARANWSGLVAPVIAAMVVTGALVSAPGAGADPNNADQPSVPVVDIVPAALPHAPGVAPGPGIVPAPDAVPGPEAAAVVEASGPVIVPAAHVGADARLLGPGVCPEDGLQVNTILAGRAISAAFPQIQHMIGVRPDAKPWHPSGRAIDIMIPDFGSAAGIALGDAILDFAMKNADKFRVQDVIWRGTYYTPANGPSGSGYGHYDHVHITTFGGGYPTGNEEYLAG